MAVLTKPASERPYGDLPLAPAGTYTATLIDVVDQFQTQRRKFDNPTETETVDLTTFCFGFRDAGNNPHKVATGQMLISGSEKSTLYKMLSAMLGRAPAYGWDYAELKGSRYILNIIHKTGKMGGTYAQIMSIMPAPAAGQPNPVPAAVAQPPAPAPAHNPPTDTGYGTPGFDANADDIPF